MNEPWECGSRERGTDEEGEGRQRSRVFSSNPSPCGTPRKDCLQSQNLSHFCSQKALSFPGNVVLGKEGVNLIKLKKIIINWVKF